MKITYKRHETGYAALLGGKPVAFLERGAPMQGGSTSAWLIWLAALPGEVEVGTFAHVANPGKGGSWTDPVSSYRSLTTLFEYVSHADEVDPVWMIHRYDAGSLAEAKHTLTQVLTELERS